ncbi:inovirus-type Gp2 protein [Aeromonas veronii]
MSATDKFIPKSGAECRVHFPDDAEYRFDRRDADLHNENFYKFLERTAYLFKLRSKVRGERNFGRSQLIR